MNVTKEQYKEMVKDNAPKTRSIVNVSAAFIVGGAICAVGEILTEYLMRYFDKDTSVIWTSVILVLAGSLLTGLRLYSKMAKFSGAGTLVPITGFSNAITSSAIEAKSEGLVIGIGAKIFTIAGPVLLYGTLAAVIYGLFYYFIK